MNIEKDWRPVATSAVWSMVLMWVPTAIYATKIALAKFDFDGQVLSYTRGLITKTTETVDLRRVRKIDAHDSPFTGGKLIVTETSGATKVIPFVKKPAALAAQLRTMAEAQSRSMGDVQNRVIS